MKETKQAKENVERWKEHEEMQYVELATRNVLQCIEHKQTCQRWLEWVILNRDTRVKLLIETGTEHLHGLLYEMNLIIDDLKQAIKTYEDAGI